MSPPSSGIEAKIRAFLRSEPGLETAVLEADTPLVSSGLVDSAGLVRLAALLERETGLLIPDADLSTDHFDSIARVLAYLARRAG